MAMGAVSTHQPLSNAFLYSTLTPCSSNSSTSGGSSGSRFATQYDPFAETSRMLISGLKLVAKG